MIFRWGGSVGPDLILFVKMNENLQTLLLGRNFIIFDTFEGFLKIVRVRVRVRRCRREMRGQFRGREHEAGNAVDWRGEYLIQIVRR